ncbi:MAG: FAD-dependent oxidoreductase [Betaproteobacteria bacterium]|nr:FAD-dependent oxidoreductase [Betaproteobacteria bacterium]
MIREATDANIDYQRLELAYARCADQDAAQPARHPVIVVGAGPVGLTMAIDLARQAIPVVVLDDDCRLSTGSRAICFAKRTLEIWDRLGVGQRMVDKGVSWSVGKVFFQDALVYAFNLLPEGGHHRPAFINLQQYYCEGYLYEAAAALPNVDLRWKSRVVALEHRAGHVELEVQTPEGAYRLHGEYVVACDGSRSPLRTMLGQEARGRTFHDRFLIADVRMSADFPAERWFWFDPPFHRNQSVLLHRQPDNVWRIDFQLGWNVDPDEEKKPSNVIPRIKALLGGDARFELEWVSVYTFACQRMERFRHGRVIFAGDAAHGVSPFGARGANSGVQDADNLGWKLGLVLAGKAPDRLLDSYGAEREFAADENILNSTRSTDFITPKSEVSRTFRDAVLKLAQDHPFARRLVNSGRLSVPATLSRSWLNTPDRDACAGAMTPGAPAADAPVRVDGCDAWFLQQLRGVFVVVVFSDDGSLASGTASALRKLAQQVIPIAAIVVVPPGAPQDAGTGGVVPEGGARGIAVVEDVQGLLARRYDACVGTCYLLRPDQHVCARWRAFDADAVIAALARATCNA